MSDRFEAHVLKGLRCQRRSASARSEEEELFAGRKNLPMVGSLRIDPEFQHPARGMERARDAAVAIELANIADVDEQDVRIILQLDSVRRRDGFDLGIRLGQHLTDRFLELQRHNVLDSRSRTKSVGAFIDVVSIGVPP